MGLVKRDLRLMHITALHCLPLTGENVESGVCIALGVALRRRLAESYSSVKHE